MKDRGFFDKAREAKEAAAARATELAQKAPTTSDELKAIAGDVKQQVAAQLVDINEAAVAKLSEVMADFNAALPVLREAGYALNGVRIELSLTPRITADFDAMGEVSDETVEKLLDDHAEQKLTVLLVNAVHHATWVQSKLDIRGLRPAGVSVDLGLMPQVSVKLKPMKTDEPASLTAASR